MPDQIEHGLATFAQRSDTERRYMGLVIEFLQRFPSTTAVEPATRDQQIEDDIDLVWWRIIPQQGDVVVTVEVKIDHTANPRNFFLETVSNELRSTPGCFLRTRADKFFYYFTETDTLWTCDTDKWRSWFLSELSLSKSRFPLKETFTQLPSGAVYPTLGRTVPIDQTVAGLGEHLRSFRLR